MRERRSLQNYDYIQEYESFRTWVFPLWSGQNKLHFPVVAKSRVGDLTPVCYGPECTAAAANVWADSGQPALGQPTDGRSGQEPASRSRWSSSAVCAADSRAIAAIGSADSLVSRFAGCTNPRRLHLSRGGGPGGPMGAVESRYKGRCFRASGGYTA